MKKILFSLIFLCFIFLNIDFSFADTYVVQLPSLPTGEDTFSYYAIRKIDNENYRLYFLDHIDGFENVSYTDSNNVEHLHYQLSPVNLHVYDFNVSDSSWKYVDLYTDSNFFIGLEDNPCRTYVYANFELVDSSGSVILPKYELTTGGFDEPKEDGILDGIGSFFSNLFDNLDSWFGSVIDYIKSIPSSIAYLFTNLGNLLSGLLNDILTYIKSIPSSIVELFKTLFEFLFVPSDNLFNDFETLVKEKFNIFFQLGSIVFDSTTIEFNDAAPNFSIKVYGQQYTFVDLSFYAKYRTFIHGLIILFTAFGLSRWLLINCPNIIRGESVDPKTGEVYTTLSNGRR